jgi:hypothetical protein
MEDLLKEKIFVTEECERLIHTAYRQYNVMAVLFFFSSATSTFIQVLRFYKYKDMVFTDWVDDFNLRAYPLVAIFMTCLWVVEIVYYYYGIRYQKESITESNQLLFNRSFSYFKRGNTIAIVVMSISLACEFILAYEEVFIPY